MNIARMGQVPPQVRSLSGTVWSGKAKLDGGLTLSWQMVWRSLPLRGRIEANLRVNGPQTLMEGRIFASPRQVALRNVTGRAGAEVLALLRGAAPCDGRALVDIDRVSWSRGAVIGIGRVRISESRCFPPGGTFFDTPALNLDLATDGAEGVATLTTDDAARAVMGAARLNPDGWARVRIEPEGARLVPGLPDSAATLLEFQWY